MNAATTRVRAGIVASKTTQAEYWGRCLAQRAGLSPMAAGSVYPGMTPEALDQQLLVVEWEEYSHPTIMEQCSAFVAPLAGQLGIIPLAMLASDHPVTLDDRKGTGKVSAVVEGVRGEIQDFTVLIIGPDEGGGPEFVWTFHPGAPIAASRVPAAGRHGEQITTSQAIALGLDYAKIG